jgi:3-oxoacyl-[acyl-carrier-protein] synthase III
MSVGIHAVRYVLGEQRRISALRACEVDRSELVRLAASGVLHFRQAQESLLELALAPALDTLNASGLSSTEIDALLLLTNSYKAEAFGEEMGNELLRRLGLINAYLHGVYLQGCADLILGLKTAQALVASGQCRHILMIVTDKVGEAGVPVVMCGSTVHSDAASSCLVSHGDDARYRLGSAAIIHAPVATQNGDDTTGGANEPLAPKYACLAMERALAANRISREEIDLVLTNNLNQFFFTQVGEWLGLERRKIFDANLSAVGHCLASDILINLASLVEPSGEEERRNILLFATSRRSYAAMTLTRSGAPRSDCPLPINGGQ